MGWAYPDGSPGRESYGNGGLQAVTAGGRALLAGMYCDAEGRNRVDLRDAVTGAVIDAYCYYKEWWSEPSRHFASFRWQGGTYVRYIRPRYGYRVRRVTPEGFADSGHETREDDVVSGLVFAERHGRPVIAVCCLPDVVFRDWGDADVVLGSWTAPAGWDGPELVTAGGRCYAWLGWDVPDETPFADKWRVAAEHGSRLWDVIADEPAGAPLLVRGYQWGPWELAGRPVVLFKVDWRDFQLWDVGRREPLGPGLGDLDLENPSAGLLHGRPVLAGSVGSALRVWDVGTGRLLGEAALPDEPIATAIDPGAGARSGAGPRTGARAEGFTWAITRTGYLGRLTVTAAQINPVAARHSR